MLDEAAHFDEVGKLKLDSKAEAEEIKNKYDKRIYLLDLLKSILCKIRGYDYRYSKQTNDNEIEVNTTDVSSSSESSETKKLNNEESVDWIDHATTR